MQHSYVHLLRALRESTRADSKVHSESCGKIFLLQPEQCSSINTDSNAESDSQSITAKANKWTDYTCMKAAFRSVRNIFPPVAALLSSSYTLNHMRNYQKFKVLVKYQVKTDDL